jgi:hypothetical protein
LPHPCRRPRATGPNPSPAHTAEAPPSQETPADKTARWQPEI